VKLLNKCTKALKTMKSALLCFFEECYRAEVAEETEETIGL
jgi:hypothetical protein